MPMSPKPDDKAEDPKKKGASEETQAHDLLTHALGTPPKSNSPAVTAAVKPEKSEPTTALGIVKDVGTGALNSLIGFAALGDKHKTTAQILSNDTSAPGGTVGAIINNVYNVVSNPVQTAKGLYQSGEHAAHVVWSGTAKERAQLAGGALVNIGAIGLGGAGTVSRMGTSTEALALGERAAGATTVARTALGDFNKIVGGTERTAAEAAAAKVVPQSLRASGVAKVESTLSPFSSVRSILGIESRTTPALAGFMDSRSLATRFTSEVRPGGVSQAVEGKVIPNSAQTAATDGAANVTNIANVAKVDKAVAAELGHGGKTVAAREPLAAAERKVSASQPELSAVGRPDVQVKSVKPESEVLGSTKVAPADAHPHSPVREQPPVAKSEVEQAPVAKPDLAHSPVAKPEVVQAEVPNKQVKSDGPVPVSRETVGRLEPGGGPDHMPAITRAEPGVADAGVLTRKSSAQSLKIDLAEVSNLVGRDAEKMAQVLTGMESEATLLQPLQRQVQQLKSGKLEAEAATNLQSELKKPDVAAALERNPEAHRLAQALSKNAQVLAKPVETAASRAVSEVRSLTSLSESPVLSKPFKNFEENLQAIAGHGATPTRLADLQTAAREFESTVKASGSELQFKEQLSQLRQSVDAVTQIGSQKAALTSAGNLADNLGSLNKALSAPEFKALADKLPVQKLETALREGRFETLPASAAEVQQVVRLLEKEQPQFTKLLADRPELSRLVQDIKVESSGLAASKVDLPALSRQLGQNATRFAEVLRGIDGAELKVLEPLKAQIEQFRVADVGGAAARQLANELEKPAVVAVLERNPLLRDLAQSIKEDTQVLSRPVENSAQKAASHVETISEQLGLKSGLETNAVKPLAEPLRNVQESLDAIARDGATPKRLEVLQDAARKFESASKDFEALEPQLAQVRSTVNNVITTGSEHALTNSATSVAENIGSLSRLLSAPEFGGALTKEVGSLEKLQAALKDGTKADLPASAAQVRELVATLEKPQYAKYLAEKPEAQALMQDIKLEAAGVSAAKIDLGAVSTQVTRDAGRFSEAVARLDAADAQVLNPLKKQIEALPSATSSSLRQLAAEIERPEVAAVLERNPQLRDLVQSIKENGRLLESPLEVKAAAPGELRALAQSAKIDEVLPKVEALGQNLSPELASALKPVEVNLQALSREFTPQAAENLRRAMAEFETKAAAESGLNPTLRQATAEVRTSVDQVAGAALERGAAQRLDANLQTVAAQAETLNHNVGQMAQLLREAPALSAAENRIVESLGRNLDRLEGALGRPVAAATVSTTAREIEQIVRDLERPEYSRFLAENPRLARALEEVKTSSNAMASSVARVESQVLTLEKVQAANSFRATTGEAIARSESLLASNSAELKLSGVSENITGFTQDLQALRNGANAESVLNSLRNRAENVEAAGATTAARELKDAVSELERSATVVGRTQRIEASALTVERESANVSAQSQNLARSFADDANLAPSRGIAPSPQAQIAENLDFVKRQSATMANTAADVQTVSRIKDALGRIEELGQNGVLSGQRAVMFEELKQSVAKLDRAAVEAQGLRAVEEGAASVARQADRISALTGRISETVVRTDGRLAESVGQIESTVSELKLGPSGVTLETQSRLASRLVEQVADPAFQQAMRASQEGARLFAELKSSVSAIDDAVKLRSLEQNAARLEGQAARSAEAAKAVQGSATDMAANVNLQRALNEYNQAARDIAFGGDRRTLIGAMDENLAVVKRELGNRPEVAALSDSHEVLRNSVALIDTAARELIQTRLPAVESYFTQLSKADSSFVQREIIRQASQDVQTLRYLEGHTTLNSSSQLELAQSKLVSAANDLEVAAYRRNLLRLASEGVKGASDKFLVAGLTSDGFKATSMARSLTSTMSNFAEMVKIRARLIPVVGGENGALLRQLSANDALFANNRSLLFSPEMIRYGSAAMIASGVGTMYYSSRLENSDLRPASVNQLQSRSAEASVAPLAGLSNPEVSQQAIPAGYRPETFTPVGQELVRSAFANDVRNRAINQNLSQPLAGTTEIARPLEYVAGHTLKVDDPNFNQKYTWLSTYGVDFAPSLKSEEVKVLAVPIVTAQSLNLKPRLLVDPRTPFEKPASDRFVMPTSMTLNSPLSLISGSQAQRRDVNSVRGNFLGTGPTASVYSAASDAMAVSASLQHEAETEAGSNGVQNMRDMERTETAIDHAVGGGVVNTVAAVDPDHDDDEQAPTTSASQVGPSAAAPKTMQGPPRKKSHPDMRVNT
jgi:hypothetical protein